MKYFYKLSDSDSIHKQTYPWDVGHEVYETGNISDETLKSALFAISNFLSCHAGGIDVEKIPAVATGAFRDARNRRQFISAIRVKTKLRVETLEGEAEAALLNAQFLRSGYPVPSFAFDLGGGGLKWVHVLKVDRSTWGYLPIGATRLFRMSTESGEFNPKRAHRIADEFLRNLPRVQDALIVGTGGPIKAIAKVLGGSSLTEGRLRELEEDVLASGPPTILKPHRQLIFQAGIILAGRLLATLGSREMRFKDLPVGRVLLAKIFTLYDSGEKLPEFSEVLGRISFSEPLPVL